MATAEDCQTVRDALRDLCEPLRAAVQQAWELADGVFVTHDMPEEQHRGGRAHLARHLLRRELRKKEQLGGWTLPARCTPNAEVKLVRETMSLKVLRPALRGDVPAPGPNRARMFYYRNPKLNLYGADGSNLIAIWKIDTKTGEPEIRVVRTEGIWKSLRNEQVDIDFILPEYGKDLAEMEFAPSDEELPLPFDEPGEEDGESGEEDGDVG